jgi:hypothetical protein
MAGWKVIAMEPVAIFLLLFTLILTVLFITRPFLLEQINRKAPGSLELSLLLAERESLLNALQELDLDQALGKIPVDDYPAQRKALLQRGAEILRKLDAVADSPAGRPGRMALQAKDTTGLPAGITDDDLEDMLARRRNGLKNKTTGFCPQCGNPIQQSDVFCPTCGRSLK